MQNVGKDFKPLRHQNIKQWRKVEMLFRRGYRWKQEWVSQKITEGKGNACHYVTLGGSPQARTLREAKEDYPPRS